MKRAAILLVILLCGCAKEQPCDPSSAIHGTLITGPSQLRTVVFPAGEVSPIEVFSHNLTPGGGSLSHGPQGKLIVSAEYLIREVDIETGEMKVICEGDHAAWEPVTDSIVYWHGKSKKIVDQQLYIADRQSPVPSQPLCRSPRPIVHENGITANYLSSPVILGKGLVAVFNEDRQLCILNARTRELEVTEFSEYWPQAARGDGSSLFCTERGTWNVYEIDLAVRSATLLPGLSEDGFVFIGETNSLLFSTLEGRWFPMPHEISVTKLYNIESHTTCTLGTDPWIHQDHALWFPL